MRSLGLQNIRSVGVGKSTSKPELLTNGNFVSNVNGWTSEAGGTPTWVSAGHVTIVAAAGYSGIYQVISTVVGKTYTGSMILTETSGDTYFLKSDTSDFGTGNRVDMVPAKTASGAYSGTFVATATTSYIHVTVNPLGTSHIGILSVK